MKAILNTVTTNQQGDDPKHNSNVGRITTRIEGESNGDISIDAYKGHGNTYERRSDAQITIYYGGRLKFEGTLTELISRIKTDY